MTPYYEREEWAGWLASIREMPDDDNRRLVCADWLEENGESERAEFIRVCCGRRERGDDPIARILGGTAKWPTCDITSDWSWSGGGTADPYPDPVVVLMYSGVRLTFDRGFISRVSGPLAALHGGECECVRAWQLDATPHVLPGACCHCHGTGRTPGVLGEILRREPVTAAGIVVTDREPWEYHNNGKNPYFAWFRGKHDDPRFARCELAEELWPAVANSHQCLVHGSWADFHTPDAARLALGSALFRLHSPHPSTPPATS